MHGDLEIALRSPGWNKLRMYRSREISRLVSSSGGGPLERYQAVASPLMSGRSGSVRFDYGARTIHAAAGLDEAEGRLIVDWLSRRLPAAAVLDA